MKRIPAPSLNTASRAPAIILCCSAAVMLLALAGCGQKGPLFMPLKQPALPNITIPAPTIATPVIPVPAPADVPAPKK